MPFNNYIFPSADCGTNDNTTKVVVNVKADFTGHPTISPRVLMSNAVWNLCLDDETRRQRGEADLCWCGVRKGRGGLDKARNLCWVRREGRGAALPPHIQPW